MKLKRRGQLPAYRESPPARGRGLKRKTNHEAGNSGPSPPARGRGLKRLAEAELFGRV